MVTQFDTQISSTNSCSNYDWKNVHGEFPKHLTSWALATEGILWGQENPRNEKSWAKSKLYHITATNWQRVNKRLGEYSEHKQIRHQLGSGNTYVQLINGKEPYKIVDQIKKVVLDDISRTLFLNQERAVKQAINEVEKRSEGISSNPETNNKHL